MGLHIDANTVLTAIIAAITVWRWAWDKRFAQSLDIDRVVRDVKQLRAEVDGMDERFTEKLDREIKHLRELFERHFQSCINFKQRRS